MVIPVANSREFGDWSFDPPAPLKKAIERQVDKTVGEFVDGMCRDIRRSMMPRDCGCRNRKLKRKRKAQRVARRLNR
jgi:hypothetical protein